MKIRPLNERVLVKRLAGEEMSAGGIIIPDNAKEKPMEGEIVAVAKGDDMQVKVGDKVLFAKYAETEVKIEGEDYLLLRQDDLLGVL
ncbi:MAG: co-chaperone GroES [Deltaproteobacteria bacterium]|nr:co-chaperone GroES [Deltaproteobacteria bacterium]